MTYDSISCIALEIRYKQYLACKDNRANWENELNLCEFRPGSTIDFDKFTEDKIDQETD